MSCSNQKDKVEDREISEQVKWWRASCVYRKLVSVTMIASDDLPVEVRKPRFEFVQRPGRVNYSVGV